jgi:hypothetical protein
MPSFWSLRLSRKTPAESPKALVARSHARFSLPFGRAALKAKIELPSDTGAEPVSAHLWDISDAGGCLAVQGACTLAAPAAALLSICDPASRQCRQLRVELRWISNLSHGTFIGVRFAGAQLPQDIFLRDFMKSSWADAVPGGAAYA